ncbi:T6SS effector amidase Tae4 family protein [Paraliomyxa miuraensis]|uniref:T6SS effector amidase Tae4 family protein n=1 Tax=Paraliomyxa miuraensis TaxID=376150 RepID=UPI002254A521|nr:T6SS effector amidase Tae4 family protein [Paraliomyxa miuraensis]MCX4242219.1 T6SS effector amidase Tae4 family protein [Paraliomyxa miuraensis]
MPARLQSFDKMWDAYPNPGESADAAKHTIGGQVDSERIDNTCVIRISRAFNYSGNPIPRSATDEIATLRGADGKNYAFRVREFTRYMRRKYGAPDFEHVYPPPGGGEVPPSFKGRQGLVIFEVDGWNDATGHIDLWNGTRARHNAYFNRASRVMLWEVPDAPARALGGSVGEGGRNDRDDVELVQQLLADNGIDPGSIDGVCGPKTIAALRKFQARFLSRPDGRVDPDGRTFRELLGL